MKKEVRTSRFDTKLSKKQKELFEYAAKIGGFRTLTDFVITSVQEKAEEIVEKHRTLLASEKDREIFFNALMNPPKPSRRLKDAATRYKEAFGVNGV
jgi:uncharacterized protein (DUF1778 family)